MFPNVGDANTHRGTSDAKLDGTSSFWSSLSLATARGFGASSLTAATVAGPTNGIEVLSGAVPAEWITLPLSADFTISGTITANIWSAEATMNDNVAVNVVIEKIDGTTGTLTQIAKSARIIEVAVTTLAADNFTVTPTSTLCKKGDRLRLRIFADDAGTMGSGGTLTVSVGSPTASASGDSWIQFTENLTFLTSVPAGSTYYLTDTAATINPGGAVEKVAAKTRGGGSVNAVTNTAAGPTAGIQITASAGGTALEWYTPPLEAVTIGGMATLNVRASESNASANSSLSCEIAIVATDGSGASAWAKGYLKADPANGERGEISTPDPLASSFLAGPDTAVSAGQRLRFRLFVDDCGTAALAS